MIRITPLFSFVCFALFPLLDLDAQTTGSAEVNLAKATSSETAAQANDVDPKAIQVPSIEQPANSAEVKARAKNNWKRATEKILSEKKVLRQLDAEKDRNLSSAFSEVPHSRDPQFERAIHPSELQPVEGTTPLVYFGFGLGVVYLFAITTVVVYSRKSARVRTKSSNRS